MAKMIKISLFALNTTFRKYTSLLLSPSYLHCDYHIVMYLNKHRCVQLASYHANKTHLLRSSDKSNATERAIHCVGEKERI